MKGNLFSIIMPAYNAESTIEEAIKSVQSQTYKNFELIIVDDSSNDLTCEIIQKHQANDLRIQLIKLEKNLGVANARNQAIKKASGTYIAFLDSDDLWLPEKLNIQRQYLEEGYDIVFSSYYKFSVNKEKEIKVPEKASYNSLLRGNFIGNLTGVYNQKKLGKHYQEAIGHEDFAMWLNLLKLTNKAIGIQEPLARYRISNHSLSGNKIKASKWTWLIYRESQKLSLFKSAYYFSHYVKNSIIKNL